MKLQFTKMLNRYIFKFIFRLFVFGSVLFLYLTDKGKLTSFVTQPVSMGITPLHVLWLVFMVIMVFHLFPKDILSMALRKAEGKHYEEVAGYDRLLLYEFVQKQNERAWKVMLLWLSVNAVFGFLYLIHVMDETDLIMLTVFYFLCDYICILFFCPFQSWYMKNRCCINCRIYDWGHFMMFTPMLFIKDFFSWSLFFTSIVVLIHWEIIYTRHPERFWYGSNKTLQCASCKDKTCQIKKRVSGEVREGKLG